MSTQTDMNTPLGRLARGISVISIAFAGLGGLGIVGIMVLINADVIGRGAFSIPVPATAEMVSAAIVAVVFLQLPLAIGRGRAVRSDMLITRLHRRVPRAGSALDAVHHLAGAVMIAILVYYLWPQLVSTLTQHRTVGLQGIFILPRWPFTLCVFLGAVLAMLQYLLMAVAFAWRAITGDIPDE